MPSLADLALRGRARLVNIGGERHFRRRLLELGFLPGAEVRLRKIAPLGDPMEFEVQHCRVSLRRSDAAAIEVEVLP